jgi:hypothetical protein
LIARVVSGPNTTLSIKLWAPFFNGSTQFYGSAYDEKQDTSGVGFSASLFNESLWFA